MVMVHGRVDYGLLLDHAAKGNDESKMSVVFPHPPDTVVLPLS